MNSPEPPSAGQAQAVSPDLSNRREGDRALRFWREREASGSRAGFKLDIALPDTWAHCFVLLPRPEFERSVLLAYGRDFAHAFGLPIEAVPPVPIAGQLPGPVAGIFQNGCADAQQQNASVRTEGEIEGVGGRRELYRAVFIPIHEANRPLRVFGSFNSRPVEPVEGATAVSAPPPPTGFWQRLINGLFPPRP